MSFFGDLAKKATGKAKESLDKAQQYVETHNVNEITKDIGGAVGDFADKAKDKAKAMSDEAKARSICTTCNLKMNMMEMTAKTGLCAKCTILQDGLLDVGEGIDFVQAASYREGHQAFPNETKKHGFLFVCQNHIVFRDQAMKWKVVWDDISSITLDKFKPSGMRAVLAGANARMLQEVKNYFCVTYIDSAEWTVKFQIHGALSIPGEGEKAAEVLGYTNKYKPRFGKNRDVGKQNAAVEQLNASDIPVKIAQIKVMLEQGLIDNTEFAAKKKELLDRM